MTSEILSGPPEPLPDLRLAVLGAADWADADTLARLIAHLTGRFAGARQVVLVLAGPDRGRPDVVHQSRWSVQLIPALGQYARQDRELVAWCDAALVIGPREPWERLLRLFDAAGKPARVHTERPKLPRADYDPLAGL